MDKDNKKRLMLMKEVLEKYSDEDHPITTVQIMEILEKEYGMKVHRTTVARDVADLADMGVDVQSQRSTQNRYFVGSRYFELAELKLLIDAVASSKFISENKSYNLLSKLSSFASVYQQESVKRNIRIESRIKPDNERSLYIVDSINEAINKGKKIKFRYYDYDISKHKQLRNDGKPYVLSPYTLVWNGDYYYVVGYSDKHKSIGNFRVDRIESTPEILFDMAVPMPADFNISEYIRTVFRMYDACHETVQLKCTADMMKVIIDRFDDDVQTKVVDENHFIATVEVALSPNFYGWLFGFGDKIRLIGPDYVVEEYRGRLMDELKML